MGGAYDGAQGGVEFLVCVGPLAGVQLGVDGELEPQIKLDRWGKTCPTLTVGGGEGAPNGEGGPAGQRLGGGLTMVRREGFEPTPCFFVFGARSDP